MKMKASGKDESLLLGEQTNIPGLLGLLLSLLSLPLLFRGRARQEDDSLIVSAWEETQHNSTSSLGLKVFPVFPPNPNRCFMFLSKGDALCQRELLFFLLIN